MKVPQPGSWQVVRGRVHAALDAFLYGLGVYGIPVVIGLVTLIAVTLWKTQYPAGEATALEFSVLEQRSEDGLEPGRALQALARKPPVKHHDTRLSEAPFWFVFTVPPVGEDVLTDLELPSRHAAELTCWDAGTQRMLGSATRAESVGQMSSVKAGFRLGLGKLITPAHILCRGTFAGPARITALQWPEAALENSNRQFHRNAGLLEGGLIILSLFVLVTAVINRQWLYVLFAAWLIASLRLAAISAGWDTQWFDHSVPQDWILPMRKLTIAAYYALTYTLFSQLFREDLKRVGYPWLLQIALWSSVALLVVAAVLPFSRFLPFLWFTAAAGIAILVFLLGRILLVTHSRVAMWYGASLGIVLFSGFYEVIAAALGFKGLIGAVNSITAAFSSSLMAALAIAEQMRQERQERVRAQAELRGTYEAIPIGLFTLDRNGFFERVNPALTQMLDVDPSGRRREHWSDHFEQGAWRRLQDVTKQGADQEMEVRSFDRSDSEPKRFLVKATLNADKVEGSLQDITDKYKATEKLRFLAEHDPLTGVLNRRGIETALEDAMQRVPNGEPLSIGYLDLDRFKLINDLFGHIAGDEVLKQVCQRVGEMLHDGHVVGRIGGDEFVVVFRNTEVAEAARMCRAIIARLETSNYLTGDKAFQVKGSMGLIEVAQDLRVKDAISMADRACRAAKRTSGDGLTIYERGSPEFVEREREMRLVQNLGAGVAPDGLFLMMQPIMSLSAPYDSLNFEVLVRMRERDGSVTPAGNLIAAAENNGRAAVIDRWVLANTLSWLDRYHDVLKRTRFVCMNLSGASLNDEKFVHDAFAMLARHGRAAERLCIEITESVALHDLENTRRFIDKVRGFGAKIALDDFGAGYTSFSYLKELPADAVKIDGSFITGINKHPANLAIVEAIVELARNLGMKSIAEWAEDRATVESLARVGIDYVQGYAIARPQDSARILRAESSASFIDDQDVARYVRESLAPGRSLELWDPLEGGPSAGLH